MKHTTHLLKTLIIATSLLFGNLALIGATQAIDAPDRTSPAHNDEAAIAAMQPSTDTLAATIFLPLILRPPVLIDVIFANYGRANRICLGETLSCNSIETQQDGTFAVAVADINHDGFADAVFANAGFELGVQPSRVCFGNGSGGFIGCGNLTGPTNSLGVALGDLNGDNNIDAVFAEGGDNFERPNQVCLGSGAGGFSCAAIDSNNEDTTDVALADLNGDNRLDAVFTNYNQRNRVCLGNGAGEFFSCTDVSNDAFGTEGLALGDLNGDNSIDVVFANFGSNDPHRRCLGNGIGGFTSCTTIDSSLPSVLGRDVDLGDLNGDGHLDAVFATLGSPNWVCLGNGSGGFNPCSTINTESNQSNDVFLVDMDGDNHLDAVFANDGLNQLCYGNGTGGFSSCVNIGTEGDDTTGVAVGNFD